ncbi:MAG: CHAT domain-containing protein [Gammaproteobacteria bacterium]|nr:CHAT domain-containing protein [Gammaproteobacteria bacterium]
MFMLLRLPFFACLLYMSAFPAYAQAAFMEQANRAFEQGHLEEAVQSWRAVLAAPGLQALHPEAQTGLASAYLALGFYREALEIIQKSLAVAERDGDLKQQAILLGKLGEWHLASHKDQEARNYLQQALSLARMLEDPLILAQALNRQGNMRFRDIRCEEAIAAYRQSLRLAEREGDLPLAAKAKLNLAHAFFRPKKRGNAPEALAALWDAFQATGRLPASRLKSLGLIALGRLAGRMAAKKGTEQLKHTSYKILQAALRSAEKNQDMQALSEGYGTLGRLYETEKRHAEAVRLTRQALFHAKQNDRRLPELIYRWNWQMGRLFKAQGNEKEAIKNYHLATKYLELVRRPVVDTGYRGRRMDFQRSVAPVYLELAELLLREPAGGEADQKRLLEALEVLERLKSGELQDYFQNDCIKAACEITKKECIADQHAAFLYPVLLPERTVLLLKLPSGLRRFTIPVSRKKIENKATLFRNVVSSERERKKYADYAKKLYEWLIKPLEKSLEANAIKTLVAVPDGALRNIPFAALHDGKGFLIERYALAITPGLTLTAPKTPARQKMQVLLGGISESVGEFSPLPNVPGELQAIRSLYPGLILLDDDFTDAALEMEFLGRFILL